MRLATVAGVVGCMAVIGLGAGAAAGDLGAATRAYRAGDYAAAVSLLTPLAAQGNAQAQSLLGALYLDGTAGPIDYGRALQWLSKAANQGDTAAENEMGLIYCKGLGVTRDCAVGLGWYRKAADQGDAVAALNVGLIYDLGEGVAPDPSAAASWYRIAAAKGDATAQYNLGLLYDAGRGVAQDSAEAVRLWGEAAARGEPDAQSSLGAAFATGRGEPIDRVRAYVWFSLAALGYPDGDRADRAQAERNRDIVVAQMTAAEIRQGQLEAQQWRPAPVEPGAPARADQAPAPPAPVAAAPELAAAARAPPSPPPPPLGWWVQLGAYLTEAAAREKLRQVGALPRGLETQVAPTLSGGRQWFRAVVGGFADRAAANEFCATRGLSSADCWVR